LDQLTTSNPACEPGASAAGLKATIDCPHLYALPARLGAGAELMPQAGWSDSSTGGENWLALGAIDELVVPAGAGFEAVREMIERARERLRLFGGLPHGGLARFVGGLAFDPRGPAHPDDWPAGIAARFVLPRVLVREKEGRAEVSILGTPEAEARELLGRIEAAAADPAPADHPLKLRYIDQPAARDRWSSAVKEVLASIAKGSVRKVVLSRDVVMEGDEDLDPWAMLRLIRARDPRGLRFCLRFDDGAAFVGATPERLLVQRGNEVACDCLAGTIMRGATAGEAEANAAKLLASEKDAREHRIVLEEILEAIAPHARSLDSPESPSVLMLAEVLHLWSPVRATLRGGADLAAIVSRLQPTPAVGGSPRLAAMDILRILEGRPRGWYAGLVGTIGPDHADFAVAIRSGLVKGRRLTAFGGAGIVRGSDPQAEWDETARKAASFIHLFAESA
jgi:menaquinone-specific isochorismate synthase